MDNRKPVIVWMNGKKTKLKRTNTNNYLLDELKHEQAATVDDADNIEEEDQIPVYTRQHTLNSDENYSKKRKKFHNLKPIILAIMSAVVIGTFLGFLMINFFVGIDDSVSGSQNGGQPVSTVDDQDDSEDEDETTDNTAVKKAVPNMTAYVLQGGVYNQEENAMEVEKSFTEDGASTTIWKRDESYYLFVGIASTKEQAQKIAENYNNEDLEVYVKEWNSDEFELELTNAESDWIRSVYSHWNDSLQSVSEKEDIQVEKWNSILDSYPGETETLSLFFEGVKNLTDQMENADGTKMQHILLQIWHELDKLSI
ncbi:hypothetical protein ACFQ3N_09490 [Virgibacillus byunsanensis]|uniref:SPOR domain-containing protein n=1 Tax=Virgibacillus byunsanensis TaxID=570945 RepID=A0ABW3LMI1_9BACI